MGKGYSDLAVMIPTLNEEEAIGRVLEEIISIGVPRENILVVDGGSTDGTVEAARRYGVNVIRQEGRGKADAIKTGLKHIDKPYTLIIDGDYTYPAEYIPKLYETIRKGYDMVIGARTYWEEAQPLIYRFGDWMLTKTFNLLFGTGLRDVLSGMYIIKTEKLREVEFEMKHFSVESEIVAHIASTGGRIAEVPIRYRRRIGEKKLKITHGLSIFKDMIRLTWRYNPAFLLFSFASILLVVGLVLGAWVAYHYYFNNVKYYMKGLIAIILFLSGLQALTASIITLYLKRAEIRTHRKLREILEKLPTMEDKQK